MRWRPGRSERRPSRSTARVPAVLSRSGRAAVTVRVHLRACRSRGEGLRQVAPSRRPETTRSKPRSSARVAVSRSASPRPPRASRVLPRASRTARRGAARRTRARLTGAAVGFAGGWFWQVSRMEALQDTMTGLHREAFRDGKAAADQWLALEAYNHIADVMKCKVTIVDGRRRCDTSLWIDPAPPGKGQ